MAMKQKRVLKNKTLDVLGETIVFIRPKKVKHRKRKDGKKRKKTSSDELIVSIKMEGLTFHIHKGHLKPRQKYPNDFLIKYSIDGTSGKKTPNHYVWSCDLLIKKQHEPELCNLLIDELVSFWAGLDGLKSHPTYNALYSVVKDNAYLIKEEFLPLTNVGYFSAKALIIIIVLLAVQEKTNYSGTHRLFDVLNDLKQEKIDIPAFVHDASGKK